MRKAHHRAEHYGFGPAVELAVGGSPRARRHLEREYGPPLTPAAHPPAVEATLRLWRARPANATQGGYKTARWWVKVAAPAARPRSVEIALAGGPPSFALSLVQGYYVEPLVAIALAAAGYVALPAAAILSDEGALVIMGHAGSGKSSVSVRALARGLRILGDDQVVIGMDGGCWPYPRRLRLYPDVEQTAPDAWPRLRPATRRNLRARRHLRRATRGFVSPSLAVSVTELGRPAPRERSAARRLVVVVRDMDARSLIERGRDAGWAAQRAAEVIAAQRSRFAMIAGEPWRRALVATVHQEAAVLGAWLASLPITELRVPREWDAPTAVGALADRLGVTTAA